MKRFCQRSFLFTLPIILFIVLLETCLRLIPNDYQFKNNYLDNNADEIEVLILGSSHSLRDLNPYFFELKTFNAANVSQTLDFDCIIFNKYQSRFKGLKFIILPISYSSLFSRLENSIEHWRIKNYCIYFDIEISKKFNYKSEFYNLDRRSILNLMRTILSGKLPNFKTVDKYGFSGRNNSVDLNNSGIRSAKRHTVKNYHLLEFNLNLLNQLFFDCQKMNVQVVLFTPPAWKTYTDSLKDKQLSLMTNAIEGITNQFPNVSYHSFLRDDRFLESDFSDADHLNLQGAEKLSIYLNNFIKKL